MATVCRTGLRAREGVVVLEISHSSVFVDDQDKAHRFYTDVLGFLVKHDLPVEADGTISAVFDDTCGNLIILVQAA